MSDEEKPPDRPVVDPVAVERELLRVKRERLIAEAQAAEAEAMRKQSDELMADLQRVAERQIAAFAALPCNGEIARLPECSDEHAKTCEQRGAPSCPRSIVAFDRAQERERLRERLDEWSKIPTGIVNVLLGDFRSTTATQAVDLWLATDHRLLLLTGGLGCGKSVAAGYAIKRTPGRWMHASEIAKAARFEAEDRMRELLSCRLLVIDDLGAEFNDGSGWGRAALTNLLLQRYEEAGRTVITTNLDKKAWSTYADPRIKDRLAAGTIFEVPGESLRRRR
jgi:DNA replication protein DnaC